MIQMTTDEKIKALQREGIEQALNRIEHELRSLALQAFDIGYKEGYKTGKECKEEKKDCKDCWWFTKGFDEEPCCSCHEYSCFEFMGRDRNCVDTVNLKLRDINDNLYEIEIPVKEKTCSHDECIHPYADLEQCTECHNESEPLTFANVKVGDELEDIIDNPIYDHTVIIVTYNWSGCIYALNKRTGTYVTLGGSDLPNWRKTGKTYPEIAELIGRG